MSALKCSSCGAALAPDAEFCGNCGTPVAATLMMAPHDVPTQISSGGLEQGSTAPGVSGSMAQSLVFDALRKATLGEYEILAELGRGGMATVYLAHDVALDRHVAIKVMSPALLEGEGAVERFKREAKTAGALSHPHIIPIFAVKQSGELLYFVMKHVEGRSLDSVVAEQGALPIPMIVRILSEVAGALAFAHKKSVVHRDVKPANIMLDNGGWAVVTDFGIAKVARQEGLTMTGATVGTPAYMSPEQCVAKDVTGQSDQYSLGVVAYELITGKVPFTAGSLMGMFMAHMSHTPAPMAVARPDCPPRLMEIVERMMAKAPEDRWPSMDDVVTALEVIEKPETRELTRTSMMALARTSAGTPRPSEFSRPVSPIPINARTPAATASSVAAAPAGRRRLAWALGAMAAVPALGVVIWIAAKIGGSLGPPTASSADSVAARPPVVQPAVTQKATRNIQAQQDTATSAPQGTKVVASKTTAAPSQPRRDSTPARVAATEPLAVPAGNTRADSSVTPPAAEAPLTGPAAPSFTEISAGGSTTCGALTNDAGVICWGAAAQNGVVLEGVLFTKLSVGDGHICALTGAGEAFCWGANSQGQLGDGTTADRDKPTPVKATQRFVDISVGAGHTCALTADGTAFCWGGNKYGQLGDGSRSNRNRPVLVRSTAGNQGFQSLAAGGSHTCGITRTNKAFCWGDGFSGQVGNAMQDFAQEPFAVKTDLAFRTVVAGDRHTCGLTTSGRVYCWGSNTQGQLGNDTKDDRNVPDSVATDQVFRAVAAGGQHTCGISTQRQLLCWGNNLDGRLGDGTRSSRTTPVLAAKGLTFTRVSAGSGHTCALTTSSQAMCWGGNARGQLGGGNVSAYSATPTLVLVHP